MKRSLSKVNGFTLLEVLVAFSIFTVSLGILFQIFSKGTNAARLGDEYTQAVFIAQSRLASIGIESNPDIGEYRGRENNNFHWVMTVRPYDPNEDLLSDYGIAKREIEITVNWKSQGRNRSVNLNSIRLIPTS